MAACTVLASPALPDIISTKAPQRIGRIMSFDACGKEAVKPTTVRGHSSRTSILCIEIVHTPRTVILFYRPTFYRVLRLRSIHI